MRLTPAELQALRLAVGEVQWEHAWLFGSRTDDARRGGDIDLLLHTREPAFAVAHRVASRFAAEADARLDVLAIDPDRMTEEQRHFLATLTLEPLDDLLRS